MSAAAREHTSGRAVVQAWWAVVQVFGGHGARRGAAHANPSGIPHVVSANSLRASRAWQRGALKRAARARTRARTDSGAAHATAAARRALGAAAEVEAARESEREARVAKAMMTGGVGRGGAWGVLSGRSAASSRLCK